MLANKSIDKNLEGCNRMPAQSVIIGTKSQTSQTSATSNKLLSVWLKTAMLVLLGIGSAVYAAPPTIELFAGGGITSVNGPTTVAQTNTYQGNLNNPTDNVASTYSPTTTVTYSLSSTYSTSTYNSKNNQPDFVFGGASGTGEIDNASIYAPLNSIGGPLNNNFAATIQNAPSGCTNGSVCSSGTTGGIDINSNYGQGLYVTTRGLSVNNRSLNGRHLVGTITATFNRPVTNPILQVAGLGGSVGNGQDFSAEFDLVSNNSLNNSVVMSRLAGSKELTVTANQITNNATALGATTGNGGASGSVYLQGRRITSVTFNVYLRGDGGGNSWVPSGGYSGDRFFFGVSSIEADNDLSITKTQRAGTTGNFVGTQLDVIQGSTVQYSLVLANSTASAVSGASYTDSVPSAITGLSIVSTTPSTGASCTPTLSGNTISGTYNGPSGSTCTIIVKGTATTLGLITNTATLLENATDPDLSNNSSSVNTNIIATTDLAITKTGTTSVKAGQPVTYTLKVWNKGPTAVSDAIVTDIVPSNLSSLSIQCTATGTAATCGTVTPYVAGSNTRSATGVSLPVDATGNTNFATYTVKGLAYSTGSFTNTATVSSATIAESNNVDNSASQATTITTDAPVTTGNAANQCLAAAATNVITPTPFTVLDADGTSASSTGTLTATVNSTGTGYGTATNGAIVLNGKMSWSYGSPIKAGSTLTFRVNGIDVAVLTTPGASSNGSASARVGTATFTGLNGATVSQATLNIDNTYTTYSGRANFTVTLPTTITSISSAQAVYLTLNPLSPTGVTGDDFGVSIDSALQCLKPIVKIAKTSNGGTGTFAFNTLTNLSNSSGTAITTDSVTTATAGTAVTSSQTNYATALNTAVNITEAATANYVLNSLSCTDTNSGVTGNTGTFASLTTNTATINAAAIKYGANILCTFNNTKQRTLTLRKTWVNARLNDAATITATGLNSFASVADSANETDSAAAQAVNVGSTITVGENISTGVGLYNAALACTQTSGGAAVALNGNNLTIPDADVTCGYTNSRKSANLTLSKVWSNAKLNDAINITATGLTTFSSVANAANETDNAAAQTVYAGDSISFSETFTTGIASNYNAALACTGNTTALSGSNLTVNGADTAINCAYNNSRIAQQLNLSKTWQNGVNGHTATVTTTGSSNAASIISTAAGNNTTNGTAVSVYAGDTITLPAETFGGGATAAQYNSTLACAGGTTLTSGAVARSITISNSTTATVCTYTNSFIAPAKILVSGQVFEDNGSSTGISNAYNSTQETGEVGIQGSQIALTNCSSTVIATTQTDANGEYSFSVLPTVLPTNNFCIAQTNLAGYTSVSGTTGYNRVTDQITVSNTGASSYANHNFGDARLNVVLTEDGQQTIIAGGVADYPHRLTAQSVLTVTSLNQTNTQQPPANSTDAPWQSLLYLDTDCNGKVDAGENLISASLRLSLKANEQVCLVQRVYAPATASMGAQHIGQLQASFNVSLANPTETITGSSIQRQDTTLLGSAGLSMQKMVRSVASCSSTAAYTTAFATTNTAQSGGYLEYEITYRNNSLKNLVDISIKDTVPVGTVFQSNGCSVTPAGTCKATKTGDALLWQNTGILLPSQQGKVRFCVQIP